MIKLTNILLEVLTEDRCKRIADRRYSKPSAYKSGAIVRCRKGNIWKGLKEEISAEEAYKDKSSVKTVLDGKRKLGFIVLDGMDFPERNFWDIVKKFDLGIVKVPSNPHRAYIFHVKGAENEANELKDIAEKYNGYLSHKATDEDTRRIGQLLGYKAEDIESHIEKRKSKLNEAKKEKLDEVRQGLLGYLKQKLPHTPEYVIKDLIYRNIKSANDEVSTQDTQSWLDEYFTNLKWEYKKNFPITMDIFDDKTQDKLKQRIGGKIEKDVTNDVERHKTQQDLLKNQGVSQEPIILFKTKNGKYALAEGWHRTIQTFKMYPEGYIQPNVYIGLNAKWVNEILDEAKKETLRTWFKRKGAPGKTGGWVDCNTCRDGKFSIFLVLLQAQ